MDMVFPFVHLTNSYRRLRAVAGSIGLAACLAVVPSVGAHAAQDSKGTDFWLMFNKNYDKVPALSLFIASDAVTNGTVSIPGLGFSTPFSVVPGAVATVSLPSSAMVGANDGVENKGIHVTSNAEVTVYGLNQFRATTDAYLGLPTDILGNNYLVLSYPGSPDAGSEFGVAATQNNTTVTITPSVTTGGRLAGVPYHIQLNQGQVYQLIHPSDGDLTGSVVTSDKPVGVYGADRCVNIPVTVNYCDHIVEQLPSVNTWGKAFVTMPLATRTRGDTFRILASADNTEVTINGAVVARLNKGQKHEQIITGAATISSTNPVLVAQYSNGTQYDGVTSDPFMMLIPPYEQFLASYTVTTPATGFSGNYINLVAPDAVVGNISLDGSLIAAGNFVAIGTSGFSGTQIPVSLGSHTLVGTLPFGAFMYGFDSFDSYGYPGGQSLSQVAVVTKVAFSPDSTSSLVGSQYCVNGRLVDRDGQPVSGVRVDYSITGANPNTGFANAANDGVAQYCYTGKNAGTDTIKGSVGTLSDTTTKLWTVEFKKCDANGDGNIDKIDLAAISKARGQRVLLGDPRDSNQDGVIGVADVTACIAQCTAANCAIVP